MTHSRVMSPDRLEARLARAAMAAARAEEALGVERHPGSATEPIKSVRRWAKLFINTKAGPKSDCSAELKQAVDLLTAHGIEIEVCDELDSVHVSKKARAAAKAGCPLVIAAGGDGTIENVATSLIGTRTVLGIIPLGTYNNLAYVLGIPTDLPSACALIADGPVRAIDIGIARVQGSEKAQAFFEMATIGLAAALMPVGEASKDGQWGEVAKALPQAVDMRLAPTKVSLNRGASEFSTETMLLTICNTPRSAAAYPMAPDARVDDGLLDVTVYPGLEQAALVIHFAGLAHGLPAPEIELQRFQVQHARIDTEPRLPVSADSRVIGTTPAEFSILPGMLLAIAGNGPGLRHPVDADRIERAMVTGLQTAAIVTPTVACDEPTGLAAMTEPVIAFIEEKIFGKPPTS